MSALPRKSSQAPVRSILRALRVIVELNNRGRSGAAELAKDVGLPRPTVHRILETLVAAGFVTRNATDQRYQPDASVARLSLGYPEEEWLPRFAVNPMRQLAADSECEVAIATLSGLGMLVHVLADTGDTECPLHIESRAPLLASASGMLCLAFAEPGLREVLLRRLAWSEDPVDAQARNERAVARLIDLVAGRGYAVSYQSVDSEFARVLAVPVLPDGQFLAALLLRPGDHKLTHEQAVQEYLRGLQRSADLIREGFESRYAELESAIHLRRPSADA